VVWLCSPNNPTGTTMELGLAEAVAEAAPDAVVVVDEAYYEFYGVTAVPLLPKHPNMVVLRTFSKAYGLAGARVGYAVGSVDMVRSLDLVRPPQNISQFGIAAACRALADQTGLDERVAQVKAERDRLQHGLQARGWHVTPSEGNFLLVRPPSNPHTLARSLQQDGMVVRTYSAEHPRLGNWLRITVRSPEENDRLLDRLNTL
jgi:histidinol-phosphate aminotransferase